MKNLSLEVGEDLGLLKNIDWLLWVDLGSTFSTTLVAELLQATWLMVISLDFLIDGNNCKVSNFGW